MSELIPRTARPLLDEIRCGYPVITLTGPRQSGKTTLARAAFADMGQYEYGANWLQWMASSQSR